MIAFQDSKYKADTKQKKNNPKIPYRTRHTDAFAIKSATANAPAHAIQVRKVPV